MTLKGRKSPRGIPIAPSHPPVPLILCSAMRTVTGRIFALAAPVIAATFSYACSSSTTPTSADAGVGDGGVGDAVGPEAAGPCIPDTMRVAQDDAGVCCAGLFKACVG